MSNLINSIRDYILTCSFLSDWRVNVDYLGAGMEYSIDPLPCDPVIQMEEQRNSSSLRLPAGKNMIRTRESILRTADFIKHLKNGWKHRTWQENCRNLEKIKSR